jgi:hypothetical protein
MISRHRPAVIVGTGAFAFSPGGMAGWLADPIYVDPHLVVLIFLFGFCLLYAVLLAVDVVTQRQPGDPNPKE